MAYDPGMPKVAVIFTGGTIAMRSATGSATNVPTMRADELLAAVPGLERLADVEPIDWGLIPASHLGLAQVLEIGRLLAQTLARPDVDGAVVVQGTDVIEETAFAWDLLPLGEKPVVVVGAMRSASEEGYDGPDNLRNAIGAAAGRGLAGQGVVVAMAGELHGADDVRKTHTHAYATFGSPNAGRLGSVAHGEVELLRRRARHVTLPRIPDHAASPVPLVTVVLDDAGAIEAAAGRRPAGLVVAATGAGNTPAAHLEAASALMRHGVPVALTTRCHSGAARPGYAFPGGSNRWFEAGAIFTGTLDGPKARILLALGIGAGWATDELGAFCAPLGGGVASQA